MISDYPLKVCIRNFFRNKMVNLTATSVKYFLPNAEISCISFYKKNPSEYDSQEQLHPYIQEYRTQTRYVNPDPNAIHDCIDSTKTSGFASPYNGLYFTEGFNAVHRLYNNFDGKVLCLAEDHFFTTGATLKEIVVNDFLVAYGSCGEIWGDSCQANASIICFNPFKLSHIFPIPEVVGTIVEHLIGEFFIKKVSSEHRYILENRKWHSGDKYPNYCGDGLYTNSSEEMIMEMRKTGII